MVSVVSMVSMVVYGDYDACGGLWCPIVSVVVYGACGGLWCL